MKWDENDETKKKVIDGDSIELASSVENLQILTKDKNLKKSSK